MTKVDIQKRGEQVAVDLFGWKTADEQGQNSRTFLIGKPHGFTRTINVKNLGNGNPSGPFAIEEEFHTMVGYAGLNLAMTFRSDFQKYPLQLRVEKGPIPIKILGVDFKGQLNEESNIVCVQSNIPVEFSRQERSKKTRLLFKNFMVVVPSIEFIFQNWSLRESALHAYTRLSWR